MGPGPLRSVARGNSGHAGGLEAIGVGGRSLLPRPPLCEPYCLGCGVGHEVEDAWLPPLADLQAVPAASVVDGHAAN